MTLTSRHGDGDKYVASETERKHFAAVIDHLHHILPGQAPLRHFVHHNTLHGFQHLPFEEALAAAWHATGQYPYWADEVFCQQFRQGRIDEAGLKRVLATHLPEHENACVLEVDGRKISRNDVNFICMTVDIQSLTPTELNWRIHEQHALGQFAGTVSAVARKQIIDTCRTTGLQDSQHPLQALWQQCLKMTGKHENACEVAAVPLREEALGHLESLMGNIGDNLTLSRLIQRLTGIDVTAQSRQDLFAASAAYLDEGYAAWSLPGRKNGFFAAFSQAYACHTDAEDDAMTVVLRELHAREIARKDWEAYLESLALEFPGWAGMFNWRHHHQDYPANREAPASLVDYLAIRLLLDRMNMEHLTRHIWGIGAGLEKIRHYFTRHYHEFYVRFHHFSTVLPEHLAHRCAELLQLASDHKNRREHAWKQVAYEIYQIRPSGDAVDAVSGMHNPWNGAWRLFQVAQHLGFGHRAMAQLDAGQVYALLEATTGLTQEKRSYLWLCAYELQYRERLFHALLENPHRSYPAPVPERPSLQTVFCMDEREESMRRHLEEMDASIQTFGVAGFFGVAMRFTALGATDSDDLCPVVVKPGHKIEETATGNGHTAARRYVSGLDAERMGNAVMLALPNRGLLRAITGTVLLSPVALLESLGQLLFPSARAHIQSKLADAFYPKPVTRMNIHASAADSQNASLLHSGFTVDEQAARVAGVLRTIGLTRNFAPWVIILGHGSTTSNNPHQAAYHCGACSGRPGGPNARVFAGMANDHEVRAQLLHQYSIEIPPDTRFIGAEHDTCTDEINYFDTEALPNTEHAEWQSRLAFMDRARSLSALERCRRFASASAVTPLDALQHVFRRAFSLNQPRPELGHAGNASAIIGRRAVTRGIFLDRRSFLLSYDCTQDPDGHVLEALLLAATPVGAGINLEYYFSTINNAAFGCGSKVPHNLTGWFGIMEGSSSDLRTGLPQQMVEVHEPMRLLVVVEHYPEIVAQIYQKQPSLQELLGGLWVTLAVLHPEHNTLYEFHPSLGFSKWQDPQAGEALPVAASSLAWCIRSSQLLQPALIHAEYP